MFDNIFIWTQVFGLLGLILGLVAWQLQKTKHIIFFNMNSCIFWAVHFACIGAPIGMIMNIYNIPKDCLLLKLKDKYASKIICFFLFFAISTSIYNYQKLDDILPIIACLFINIPMIWNKNRNLIARGCLIGNGFWLAYCIYNLSLFGSIASALTMASAFIGMVRYERWEIGRCYRSFVPSITRALILKPQTYP